MCCFLHGIPWHSSQCGKTGIQKPSFPNTSYPAGLWHSLHLVHLTGSTVKLEQNLEQNRSTWHLSRQGFGLVYCKTVQCSVVLMNHIRSILGCVCFTRRHCLCVSTYYSSSYTSGPSSTTYVRTRCKYAYKYVLVYVFGWVSICLCVCGGGGSHALHLMYCICVYVSQLRQVTY